MAVEVAKYFWITVQILIGYNLVFPVVLYFFYLLFQKRSPSTTQNNKEADYAIIVTAYEQTQMLKAVTDSILKLKYSNYLIYIVADKCDVSNLKFNDDRILVLRPPETLGSNTRSHFYAINRFVRPHERLTIIDSDNLVDPQYLNELNLYFDKGFVAVQGVRKAKNLDTVISCLDAARDMYYHFFDGKVLFTLGSSATLAGSGMAFTTALYKECLGDLDVVGAGFDKVLQYEIVRRGYRIAFAEDAVVYDEKTSASDQLVKQRARWINTWFKYFGFGFSLVAKGLFGFNFNKFLLGIVLLRPPLFIFLLLSIAFMGANLLIDPWVSLIWVGGFALFIIGFLIGLAHGKPDARVVKSLTGIPKFIFLQVLSLLKARKANKISVATTHYHHEATNDAETGK